MMAANSATVSADSIATFNLVITSLSINAKTLIFPSLLDKLRINTKETGFFTEAKGSERIFPQKTRFLHL